MNNAIPPGLIAWVEQATATVEPLIGALEAAIPDEALRTSLHTSVMYTILDPLRFASGSSLVNAHEKASTAPLRCWLHPA